MCFEICIGGVVDEIMKDFCVFKKWGFGKSLEVQFFEILLQIYLKNLKLGLKISSSKQSIQSPKSLKVQNNILTNHGVEWTISKVTKIRDQGYGKRCFYGTF